MSTIVTLQQTLIVALIFAVLAVYGVKAFKHRKRYALLVVAGLLWLVAVVLYTYFFPVIESEQMPNDPSTFRINTDRLEWYRALGLVGQAAMCAGFIGEILELIKRSSDRT